MDTKKCKKCGRVLPVSEFYSKKSSKDGYQSYCKECSKKNAIEFKHRTSERGERIEVDGRTLVRVNPSFETFTNRELLEEIKRRGYVWRDMIFQQKVDFSKI